MPKRGKLSPEEKIKLVRRCMAGEIGVTEAGREAGVNHKAVCRWIARYEAEGSTGILPQERNRVYSDELKLQAVLEHMSGKGSLQEICKKHKIRSDSQLRSWISYQLPDGNYAY